MQSCSRINKTRDTVGLVSKNNFALSNNIVLSPSKCLRVILKKYKESSHIYDNHADLFLSQMSCMNTLS